MLTPVAFAAAGILAPILAIHLGLETTTVTSCVAMIVGPLIRASSLSVEVLIIGTAITVIGMGVGNVLLPPIIKEYFPDRVAALTTAYVVMISLSTTVPALLAVPITKHLGWRSALGIWSIISFFALGAWLALRFNVDEKGKERCLISNLPSDTAPRKGTVQRWGIIAALTALFAVSSFSNYAIFAWMPVLLVEHSKLAADEAGTLLGILALFGLPAALVVPGIARKQRGALATIVLAVLCFAIGYAGLLQWPTIAPWFWAVIAGLGPAILFPTVLVLINTRTRTSLGAVTASGLVQGVGYGAGSLGPLLLGVLKSGSGTWEIPIALLLTVGLAALLTLPALARSGFVEEQSLRKHHWLRSKRLCDRQ